MKWNQLEPNAFVHWTYWDLITYQIIIMYSIDLTFIQTKYFNL